jgi:M6 family metalloprotease-like protein
MGHPRRAVLALAVAAILAASEASATVPPRKGVRWPARYLELKRAKPLSFTYSKALMPLLQRVQAYRLRLRGLNLPLGAPRPAPAPAIEASAILGTRSIPVLMARYANTGSAPYPVANLQKELFDGPWPTGTMTDFYKEISYNQFNVTGTVFDWKSLPSPDTFYEGGSGCNGICNTSKVSNLLKDTLDANDAAINFAQYDNDGPDGLANSGDDDGYVDFVAFVHPENGGECGSNNNVWSHRWNYSGWTGGDYTTTDPKSGGGFIKVNDYVIMPALACNGSTMIQIGVFAHEFGHAFGLPDLYDTDDANGASEGIGNWCLMAGGSWGGDGASPETPAHMSAWAKEFLGWVDPTVVTADVTPASFEAAENNQSIFEIPISTTQRYLIENRQKKLFDKKLTTGGVLIWRINDTVVNAGLANNSVNADEAHKGVDLEEADGLAHLDSGTNRGDAGDAFPGSANKRSFANGTNPASVGTISVCDISDSSDLMTANVRVSSGSCAGSSPTPTPTPSTPPGGGCGGAAPANLLVLPAALAKWLAGRRGRARTP